MRWAKRAGAFLAIVVVSMIATASCGDGGSLDEDCEVAVLRCRTICNYGTYCDRYWGCCFNQCWYQCIQWKPPPAPDNGSAAPPPVPSAPPADAGEGGGGGILCSPCESNDECKAGALCIQRGGPDAGASFCGHPCGSARDCPEGFSCTAIGSTSQCVPISGACD